MNTVAFLDAVKRRHKLRSDYALAKFLGWRNQRVYEYRHTPRELDDEGCVQIAAALEVPPAYVMASIAAARAKDAAIKQHWQAAAKLLKEGTAAALLVAALAVSQFAPSSARAETPTLTSPAIHYAPRGGRRGEPERRRRRRRKSRTVTARAVESFRPR